MDKELLARRHLRARAVSKVTRKDIDSLMSLSSQSLILEIPMKWLKQMRPQRGNDLSLLVI